MTEKLPASRARAGNQPSFSKFRRGKPERRRPTQGSVKIPFNYGADHSGRDPGSLGDRGLSDGKRAAETSWGNRVELRGSRAQLDATRPMVGAATAIRHVRSSGGRASPCLHQQGAAHPSPGASSRTQTHAPADRSTRRAPSRLCNRSRHHAPRPGRIPGLDPVRDCRLVSSCAHRRRAGGSGRGRMVGRSEPFLLLRSGRGASAASRFGLRPRGPQGQRLRRRQNRPRAGAKRAHDCKGREPGGRRQSCARAGATRATGQRSSQQRRNDDELHRSGIEPGTGEEPAQTCTGTGDQADHDRGLDDPRGRRWNRRAGGAWRCLAGGTGRYRSRNWPRRVRLCAGATAGSSRPAKA